MASKNKKSTNKPQENKPKATARHAKIVKTKQEEIEDFKKKIANDKYLAKKYESKRKKEIKELPKEERGAAKEELNDLIEKRKDAEFRDKMILKDLIRGEKDAKRPSSEKPFDEDAWIKEGKKKKKNSKEDKATETTETVSAPPEEEKEEASEEILDKSEENTEEPSK